MAHCLATLRAWAGRCMKVAFRSQEVAKEEGEDGHRDQVNDPVAALHAVDSVSKRPRMLQAQKPEHAPNFACSADSP